MERVEITRKEYFDYKNKDKANWKKEFWCVPQYKGKIGCFGYRYYKKNDYEYKEVIKKKEVYIDENEE